MLNSFKLYEKAPGHLVLLVEGYLGVPVQPQSPLLGTDNYYLRAGEFDLGIDRLLFFLNSYYSDRVSDGGVLDIEVRVTGGDLSECVDLCERFVVVRDLYGLTVCVTCFGYVPMAGSLLAQVASLGLRVVSASGLVHFGPIVSMVDLRERAVSVFCWHGSDSISTAMGEFPFSGSWLYSRDAVSLGLYDSAAVYSPEDLSLCREVNY